MPIDLQQLQTRVGTWCEPISPGSPTGKSARALPAYEVVTVEIAKLQSPSQATSVDWQRIADSAREILLQQSKDLTVAGYLPLALYFTRGLEGFLEGTQVLAELMKRYWPTLFPEAARVRGRVNAIGWYVERATLVLSQLEPATPAAQPERELLVAIAQAIESVASVSREKLGNDSPGFAPLVKAIEQLMLSAPEKQPATATAAPSASTPAAPAPSAAPSAPPSFSAPALSAPPADAAGAAAFLRETGSTLMATAGTLRAANPAEPAAYRLLRTGLWLHLERPPPVAGGVSAILPLAEAKRTQLRAMESHAKWPELIEEAEGTLAGQRFNLDLHRFSARGLEMLGTAYQPARTALVAELAAWLRRAPAALELRAQDGSPMADPQTLEWLQGEVLGASPPPRASQSPGQAPAGNGESETFVSEVRALVGKGNTGEALQALDQRIAGRAAVREKFNLRLLSAKLCLDAGNLAAARALFQSLDEECLHHDLDSWEPELARVCLEGLLRSVRSERTGSALPTEFLPHYRRLCRLALTTALAVV